MIRDKIIEALKIADAASDRRRSCTLRLICATIRDRNAAARSGGGDGISDREVTELLSKMIRQRTSSARDFELDGRIDLAEEERQEIRIISEFLPTKLDQETMVAACKSVVDDVEARGLRDVGRCMTALKERYPDQIDSSEASRVVKDILIDASAS